jgi:5'-nucleotidase
MDALAADSSAVLKLHAGDAITRTLLYTPFRGEADAVLMNEVCFDAFALGNHEFDNGDAGLVEFLDYLNSTNCKCLSIGKKYKQAPKFLLLGWLITKQISRACAEPGCGIIGVVQMTSL